MNHDPGDWRSMRTAMREARREARRAAYRGRMPTPRAPLTPEQTALRDAKRAADARIGFMIHGTIYSLVIFGILVSGGFGAAFTTAIFWGIGLASPGFIGAIAGPDLRKRWTEERAAPPHARTRCHSSRRDLERPPRAPRRAPVGCRSRTRSAIRSPPRRAWCSRWARTRRSHENVEYAQVALQELDRVERSISHLLRYAREEELQLDGDCDSTRSCTPRSRRCASACDALGVELRADVDERRRAASATPSSCAAS